jgi:predicted dehydrogenase
MKQKLKMGMVGGGRGALIGAVHRMAACLDGKIELVSGVFSANAENSKASGEDLGLDSARVYGDYRTIAAEEAKLPVDERIDFVSIVTPNYLHFPTAKTFLEAGFNVVCDKPMTHDLDDARALRNLVNRSGKVFALTHNYTGYPMVKEAREMVRRGDLGEILKVVTQYPQGWLINPIEIQGHTGASWRTDPDKAGVAGCLSDIGCHAQNLGHYITGLEMEELCADLTTFVPGRRLEDDANILVRYKGGSRGIVYASQISVGEENDINIQVYGKKASLEWHNQNPNELLVKYPDTPRTSLRRGNVYVSDVAKRFTRLPWGHPEGSIEAFANIYAEAARAISAEVAGNPIPKNCDFPTVDDGVSGMSFIATAVQSAKNGSVWTN